MEREFRHKIGVAQGDINSTNYELILKALSDQRVTDLFIPVFYGFQKLLSESKKQLGLTDVHFQVAKTLKEINIKKNNLINLSDEEPEWQLGEKNTSSFAYALQALDRVAEDLRNGDLLATVNMPIATEMLTQLGDSFHTASHYLAQKWNQPDILQLIISENFLMSGLINRNEELSKEQLYSKIQLLNQSLKRDFRRTMPRIAFLSAGDGNANKDMNLIRPVIEKANDQNILVFGPFDEKDFFTFENLNSFDAVMSLYKDQCDQPFKYFGTDNCSLFTAGLPFVCIEVFNQPDYAKAGKNMANQLALKTALHFSVDILKNRKEYDELTKNPLVFVKKEKE